MCNSGFREEKRGALDFLNYKLLDRGFEGVLEVCST